MKKFLFLIIILTSNVILKAQSFEAGLALGTAYYNGDLDINAGNVLKQMRPVAGVFGKYNFNSSWAVRGQVYFGQLMADEKKYSQSSFRQTRGFSFNSPLTEVSAQAEWHSIKLDRSFAIDTDDPFLSFYGFGGAGVSLFDPKTDFNEPNPIVDDVSIDKNAKFSKSVPSMMGGAGVRMRLTDQLGIGFEIGGRKIFSDYLDGISKLSGPATDYYFFNTLTVSYRFDGGGLFGGGYRGGNWSRGGGRRRVGCPNF